MTTKLEQQALELNRVMIELVKRYQFRGRNETVAHGLTVAQAYTLDALTHQGSLTMGQLSATMHSSYSTMTRVVDQLVGKALARRFRDEADRRACFIEATPKGRKLWQKIQRELVSIDAQILSTIPAKQREGLLRVTQLLCGAIDDWRGKQ